VGRLAVRPDRQGRGVATALLAAAESAARAKGLAGLRLHARVAMPDNIALFEKLGFTTVGEGRHDGYAAATFAIMERPVA
jgi:ribosomal protein S18 acetylase RimI-like enzyme